MTIFLSLMLMILISFLCTALRSAQTAGSRYLFTLATEAAVRSVFGAYDTRVWEEYRILMLTDRELAQQIGEECAQVYGQNAVMFPVQIHTVQLTEAVTVAENGAKGWESAMISYMETRLPMDLVSQWVEQMDLLKGLEDVTQWLTGFRDLLKPLIQVEQKLCRLEKRLSQAVETYRRGKALLEEMQTACLAVQRLLAMAETTGQLDETAFDEEWAALKKSYAAIQHYLRDSGWELEEISRETQENLERTADLRENVEWLLGALSGSENEGMAALADLGIYLSGLTERFDFLVRLPEVLGQQQQYLAQISQMTLPTAQEVLDAAGRETLEFARGLLEGFLGQVWDPGQMEMEEGTQEDEARVGILMQLREWLDQGILALVLEDPSQVSRSVLGREIERTERRDENDLWDDVYRHVLCGEYVLRYTDHYGLKDIAAAGSVDLQSEGEKDPADTNTTNLAYELEYAVAGKTKDSENLASVTSRLLLTRGALNFLYLLQNSSSQEGLHAAAVGLSAALGGWIPQGLMEVLLMVVWAMAEAVCDVRALLSGRQVPFWKDSASWRLALEHLWTLLDDGFVTGLDRQDGMSYEEYLRLFLFLVPVEEKCYRVMEVAEENLRAERPSFCIDGGWCRASVVVTGQAAGRQTQMKLEYGY